MSSSVSFFAVAHCLRTLSLVAFDLVVLVALAARPRAALVAENLFLRKQLALFEERKVRPRRADAATRWMMAALSQWFAWRHALEVADGGPTPPAQQPPGVDPRDGGGEYHVGTGTHRQ